MNLNCVYLYQLLLTIIIAFEQINCEVHEAIRASQLVKLRGYGAEEHNLDIGSGYVLNLVRIVNPEISSPVKHPVLFIHGIASSTTCFIINSQGVKPSDWSFLDASRVPQFKLEQLLVDEPAAKSLPFLLSNLGHDVWLMNRRASIDSQFVSPPRRKSIGPIDRSEIKAKFSDEEIDDNFDEDDEERRKNVGRVRSLFQELIERSIRGQEFDPEYWNFTMDDQAEVDIPKVIDFILETSEASKVSVVAHSLGGGLSLMLLIAKPEYADKLTKTLLLAPALHLAATRKKNALFRFITLFIPILSRYKGPLLPAIIQEINQVVVGKACEMKLIRGSLCRLTTDISSGKGGDELVLTSDVFVNALDTTGSMELAQAMQSIRRGFMRKFDYGNSIKNQLVYGQLIPPRYNASAITSTDLAIWSGNTDTLVPAAAGDAVISEMTVPVDRRIIGGNGVRFNHMAFLYHKNITTLFHIPAAKFLQDHNDPSLHLESLRKRLNSENEI